MARTARQEAAWRLDKAELEALLSRVSTLPTPTPLVERLAAVVANPRVPARELAAAISIDPGLNARLLKLVNSPLYGAPGSVGTIGRAAQIAGREALRNLILASSPSNLFRARHRARAFFNVDHLRLHSVAAGLAARAIAGRMGLSRRETELYFEAGLLHDIGKGVLLHYLPAEADAVLETVRREDCLFRTAELRLLDTDHAAIGAAVAERWNLPAPLQDAIAHHHEPREAQDPRLAAAVQLADVLARALLLGSGGDTAMPALDHESCALLRLTDADLRAIMIDVNRRATLVRDDG